MNTLIRNSVRSIRSLALFNNVTKSVQSRAYRMVMMNNQNLTSNTSVSILLNPSIHYKCKCSGITQMHTKGKIKQENRSKFFWLYYGHIYLCIYTFKVNEN